ncbi:unnamed protein product [Closterium sp. Naga37s-1]|nr:unnamed protein product [Closterium sp. Naga37s-1]
MSLVIVVSLLLLCASQPSVLAQMPNTPGGQIGGEAGIERAMSLFRLWEEAYGLKHDVHMPPSKITLPSIVPPAPHLEECEALTAARKESERREGNGQPRVWARPVNNCPECNPQPPWVRGSDADNLPLTRVAQRDLWNHQLFPGRCDGKRLLVVPWPKGSSHGMGSQIHLMSTFLSLALIHNRTLVPTPESYDRAHSETCNATRTGGSWNCYFFPIVNPDCERVVTDMIAKSTMPAMSSDPKGHNSLAASADLVVYLDSSADRQMTYESGASKVSRSLPLPLTLPPSSSPTLPLSLSPALSYSCTPSHPSPLPSSMFLFASQAQSPTPAPHFPRLWGDAYLRAPNVLDHMGERPYVNNIYLMVNWWRSQASRFMMRWPSPHMCHETNKERHMAYGLHTASYLSRYLETQAEIIRAVAGNVSETDESKKLVGISTGPPGPIETQMWSVRGFKGCNETCMSAADAKAIKDSYASVGGEPFVMRPIVSVHVRQSDKGTEMRLSSFATHMFLVHRLRRFSPDLRYSVVKESALYTDWRFLYSSNSRQQEDSRSNREYEFKQSVTASFASAIIASQCDYFVGALGSNWSRLINELRGTNGRLLAGFFTVNMGDW